MNYNEYIDLVWKSLLRDLGEFTYHLEKLQSSLNPEMRKCFDSSKEIIKINDIVEKTNGIANVNF